MVEIFYFMYFTLTPGIPLSIKHSEGFTRIGQTFRKQAER